VNPAPADIADRQDISKSMAEFYRRVATCELPGPVLLDVARLDLAVCLPVLCDFCQTVLLHADPYRRNALRPHVDLNARIELSPAYFARWLSLWTAVVDERHTGGTRSLRKSRAPVSQALSAGDCTADHSGKLPPPDQRLS
jgi:hemoglobin